MELSKQKVGKDKGRRGINRQLPKGFSGSGIMGTQPPSQLLCRTAIWYALSFSVAASGQWFNWSIAGCLLLIVLFQGSSNFSEEISKGNTLSMQISEKVPRLYPFLENYFLTPNNGTC